MIQPQACDLLRTHVVVGEILLPRVVPRLHMCVHWELTEGV